MAPDVSGSERILPETWLHPHQLTVLRDLEPCLEALLPQLRPVEDCWQPSELLPNFSAEDWRDQVEALRAEAAGLSDGVLVSIVGSLVTEEALPAYQTALNRFGGLADASGTDTTPWARWSRAWTAEEKRHGDVVSRYLYLSGRVDMQAVDATVQHLLRNGFNPGAGDDPYKGLAYVSFQERATKISWANLARLAREAGAPQLQRILGAVASDEARHERVYQAMVKEALRRDPVGIVAALRESLRHQIVMPARTMSDGHDRRLYDHFAAVAQRCGAYTVDDYNDILAHLIETWDLEHLEGLSGETAEDRDWICGLPARYRALAAERAARPVHPVAFRWIFDRSA